MASPILPNSTGTASFEQPTAGCPVVVSAPNVDNEVTDSGWVCDLTTNTQVRVVETYVDGAMVSSQTIDSGIACGETVQDQYAYYTAPVCTNNELFIQAFQSINGDPATAFGSPIPTGDSCGLEDQVVRVDYERDALCILDSNGDKVERTGVFLERSYNFDGSVIDTQTVFSQISTAGVWGAYTLQAGDVVGECPQVESQPFVVDTAILCREGVIVDTTTDPETTAVSLSDSLEWDVDSTYEFNKFEVRLNNTQSGVPVGADTENISFDISVNGNVVLTGQGNNPAFFPGLLTWTVTLDSVITVNNGDLVSIQPTVVGNDFTGLFWTAGSTSNALVYFNASGSNPRVKLFFDGSEVYRRVTFSDGSVQERTADGILTTIPADASAGNCDISAQSIATVQPAQEHVRQVGVGVDIPAGMKSYTIKVLSGSLTLDGFALTSGETYSEAASELDTVVASLPLATIIPNPAATWTWVALQPVAEQ